MRKPQPYEAVTPEEYVSLRIKEPAYWKVREQITDLRELGRSRLESEQKKASEGWGKLATQLTIPTAGREDMDILKAVMIRLMDVSNYLNARDRLMLALEIQDLDALKLVSKKVIHSGDCVTIVGLEIDGRIKIMRAEYTVHHPMRLSVNPNSVSAIKAVPEEVTEPSS